MRSVFKFVLSLFVCLSASAEPALSVDVLIEANHWKRARSIAESRLRANPNDALAHAWLAKIKSAFDDFDGAIAEAERAIALEPKNPSFQGELAEACAYMAEKVSPLKGWNYVRRMKKATDTALSLDPGNIDVLLVKMLFSWKAPLLAGGDRKLAVRIADQIVGISPAWGYLAHARLLQGQGEDATSERWLLKAVEANPSFYRARLGLATFYCCTARKKRLDMAEKAANAAIALDPSQEGGYEVLAHVYATQQRWNDLESILARAEKAVPDDPGPYFAAAKSLLDIGQDFQRAERYLNRYLSQEPEGRQPSHTEARRTLAALNARGVRTSFAAGF